MAELIFSSGGDQTKWYLPGLYNRINSDFEPVNYQSATFHAGYLQKRNVRLVAEYTLDFTYSDLSINKFNLGFASPF